MGIEEFLLDRIEKKGIEKGKHEEAVAIAHEMKRQFSYSSNCQVYQNFYRRN